MKKIFYILVLLYSFSAFSQQQEGIKFEDNLLFSELLAKAKSEKKIIFIDAFASWCGPCKLMARNIFPQKKVSEYFNANFVNARFDMEKGEGRDLAKKYAVGSYPTFLFLNSDGEVVSREIGYLEADVFLEAAKKANNPYNKSGSQKEQFEKGVSDPDFLMNIIKTKADSDFDFAKKASEKYFSVKKTTEFSRDEINALLYFIKSVNDPNYQIFVKSKEEIVKILPENIYNQFDSQIKLNDVIDKSLDKENQKINDDYFMTNAIKLVGEKEAKDALNRLKLNYYLTVNKFDEYETAALDYYKNSDDADINELNRVSLIFSEFAQKPESLKKALEWAQKSVMRGENEQNTFTLAKIYYKLNDTENARNFAELSKNIALQKGKDTGYIDELLALIHQPVK